jgi:fucose permease
MNFTYLQVFLTISLPIMGLAYALLGGLKLALCERLQLDEGKVGRLVGAFGTMFGPTILACGFLTDALDRKSVWIAGSAVLAAAILILAVTRTYRGALVAVLLLGIGWAAQVNVGNVLMRVAVPADRPREELIWATNFFDFVFGFGAFVTPMVLGLILKKLGYQKGVILLAVIALLPVVLAFQAEMYPPKVEAPAKTEAEPAKDAAPAPAPAPEQSGMSKLLSSPLFWVIGFAFLFYVPLETAVGGWATTIVTRNTSPDVPPDRAQRVAGIGLTGFWLGFTGSRLLVSILGQFGYLTAWGITEQRLLLIQAVACVALMLFVVFLKGRGSALAAVLLAGVACGPVFPTMMAIVLLSVPADTMGRAVGIFFFFASVGWTVIPAIIGSVAKRTDNIQKGFWVAAASSAVFLVLIIVRGVLAGGVK